MPLIKLDSVSFRYPDSRTQALKNVCLSIDKGEYVAIVGNNGSGKSTLVRLFNGLRTPDSGAVLVKGLDPALRGSLFAVRSAVALVFQSPVDQIVSSCVEEDVAFGPSNLGLPNAEIERRVSAALDKVGMTELRGRPTRSLSGGQQQKLAIAGALAMNPECLVFDEATSMLDPRTKLAVLELMEELVTQGMTVVHVTHDMNDAARAGRIIALEAGRIAFDGSPARFFLGFPDLAEDDPPAAPSEGETAALSMGFDLPKTIAAARMFGLRPSLDDDIETLAGRIASARDPRLEKTPSPFSEVRNEAASEPVFSFRDVSFSYLRGTASEVRALENISFAVRKGWRVALVGKTGSGKSTALQLFNSLIQPSQGSVISFGQDTKSASLDARKLRITAPLSIQRPESALFEIYAADDVAFGPRNLGISGAPLVDRVRKWMDSAGIPYDTFRDRMTRGLSGGEKRKLALAGVFALESEAVLLDEPTAALDPSSQKAVFGLLERVSLQGRTVVFATHSMEEAAQADMVAVFRDGRLADFGSPREIFYDRYDTGWGIALPFAVGLAKRLKDLGVPVDGHPLTLEALREALGLSSVPGQVDAAPLSGGRP